MRALRPPPAWLWALTASLVLHAAAVSALRPQAQAGARGPAAAPPAGRVVPLRVAVLYLSASAGTAALSSGTRAEDRPAHGSAAAEAPPAARAASTSPPARAEDRGVHGSAAATAPGRLPLARADRELVQARPVEARRSESAPAAPSAALPRPPEAPPVALREEALPTPSGASPGAGLSRADAVPPEPASAAGGVGLSRGDGVPAAAPTDGPPGAAAAGAPGTSGGEASARRAGPQGGGDPAGLLHERLAQAALRCYPDAAQRFRQQGTPTVRFCLDGAGGLHSAAVESSSGAQLLDAAARDCVVPAALPFPPAAGGCYSLPVRFGVAR